MTATIPRRYNGADDAAELHDTHRCERSWCSHHCQWELDSDGSLTRTHEREIDGFAMHHTEVAPGEEPVSIEPTIFLPDDLVGSVSIEEARSVVEVLTFLIGSADRAQRERAGLQPRLACQNGPGGITCRGRFGAVCIDPGARRQGRILNCW